LLGELSPLLTARTMWCEPSGFFFYVINTPSRVYSRKKKLFLFESCIFATLVSLQTTFYLYGEVNHISHARKYLTVKYNMNTDSTRFNLSPSTLSYLGRRASAFCVPHKHASHSDFSMATTVVKPNTFLCPHVSVKLCL
jgi:hypothetical protein